tara:strand:+ start:1935 stop:2066 length:132 start_codon:yes stop_codon:yes gene_type:complete
VEEDLPEDGGGYLEILGKLNLMYVYKNAKNWPSKTKKKIAHHA